MPLRFFSSSPSRHSRSLGLRRWRRPAPAPPAHRRVAQRRVVARQFAALRAPGRAPRGARCRGPAAGAPRAGSNCAARWLRAGKRRARVRRGVRGRAGWHWPCRRAAPIGLIERRSAPVAAGDGAQQRRPRSGRRIPWPLAEHPEEALRSLPTDREAGGSTAAVPGGASRRSGPSPRAVRASGRSIGSAFVPARPCIRTSARSAVGQLRLGPRQILGSAGRKPASGLRARRAFEKAVGREAELRRAGERRRPRAAPSRRQARVP